LILLAHIASVSDSSSSDRCRERWIHHVYFNPFCKVSRTLARSRFACKSNLRRGWYARRRAFTVIEESAKS
jgi:hypothetical protein